MNDHPIPEGASAALVRALTDGASADIAVHVDVPGSNGSRLTARRLAPLPDGPLDERPITADQTNFSVVVGDRVVVKWMRSPVPHARAPIMLGHLATVGFERIPTPYASLHRADDLVALVSAYLPDAVDGWDWCVDALIDACHGGPPADFASSLGLLAAELHAALATPSPTFPEPLTGMVNPGWGRAGMDVLRQAGEVLAGSDDALWFQIVEPYLAAEIAKADDADLVRVIHPHGDLHVGQVLRWRDGLAVTDFDGNPTVAGTAPEPAARDVAQMRTSVWHVGQIANRRTEGRFRDEIRLWSEISADDLLRAYRSGLKSRGMAAVFNHTLLRPFEIEQECRELLYAARFLPRWRYAPMGVLREWFRGVS